MPASIYLVPVMKKKHSGSKLILAGDIGGTKTRLALCRRARGTCTPLSSRTFASTGYDGLETIIGEFLRNPECISAACFGVAGPVVRGTVVATNLPWKVREQSLKRFLSIPNVSLINDLVANAYGIAVLTNKDFFVLNRGRKIDGNAALLSAGTGLGTAVLFRDSAGFSPSPSEGGHVDFGPRNRLQMDLLAYLFDRFGHVSYERLLSGAGLANIYHFLRDSGRLGKEPAWLGRRMEREDPAAVITETARLRKCGLCETALELFVSIYGAAAGNLALQVMATSGVYLGGGIAPKIISKLRQGTFMKAFTDKGRLSGIVERIPVKVIMNDRAALLGAAAHAARLLEET